MGARQKFTLSGFGILNIPVKMNKISKEIEFGLKEYHKTCDSYTRGEGLSRKKWCIACGKEVPTDQVGKAFKLADGRLIPFTEEEVGRLKSSEIPSATLEITNVIDPVDFRWFNGNHYIIKPQDANPMFVAPFNLLLTALGKTGKVALLRWFDNRTVYNAVLDAHGIVSTVFYGDEVDEEATASVGEVKPELVSMITELVKRTAKPFNPKSDLLNSFKQELERLVAEKVQTGSFTTPTEKPEPKQDVSKTLEDALAQALANAEGASGEKASTAEPVKETIAIPASKPPKTKKAKK